MTNLMLLLLTAAAVTGVVAFALGTSSVRAVLVVHGIAAFGIVALIPWKAAIVRRGMGRDRPSGWGTVLGSDPNPLLTLWFEFAS